MNCLSWSSGHAEQLLFSCLGSKVTVYSRKLQCFFLTSWFFIDKTFHLCFFWDHISTRSINITVHRAVSQLKKISICWLVLKEWNDFWHNSLNCCYLVSTLFCLLLRGLWLCGWGRWWMEIFFSSVKHTM